MQTKILRNLGVLFMIFLQKIANKTPYKNIETFL